MKKSLIHNSVMLGIAFPCGVNQSIINYTEEVKKDADGIIEKACESIPFDELEQLICGLGEQDHGTIAEENSW